MQNPCGQDEETTWENDRETFKITVTLGGLFLFYIYGKEEEEEEEEYSDSVIKFGCSVIC